MSLTYLHNNPILRAARRKQQGLTIKQLLLVVLLVWSLPLGGLLHAPVSPLLDQVLVVLKHIILIGMMTLPLVLSTLYLLLMRREVDGQQLLLIKNSPMSHGRIVAGYIMKVLYQSRGILAVSFAIVPILHIPTASFPYPPRLWEFPLTILWLVGTVQLATVFVVSTVVWFGRSGYYLVAATLLLIVFFWVLHLTTLGSNPLYEMFQYDYSLRVLTSPRALSRPLAFIIFCVSPLLLSAVLLLPQYQVYNLSMRASQLGAVGLTLVLITTLSLDFYHTSRIVDSREQLRPRLAYFSDISDLYPRLHETGWLHDGTLKDAQIGLRQSDIDLRFADLRRANLYGAALAGADMRYADLRGSSFGGADLSAVDLSFASLGSISLTNADLQGARLRYVGIEDADLRDVDFRRAQLVNVSFTNVRIFRSTFAGASLSRVDFRGVDLYNTDFNRATLDDMRFDESTTLPDRNPWSSDVELRRFTESGYPDFWAGFIAREQLPLSQLDDLDLENASLAAVEFQGANLHGSYMAGAAFQGSDLRNADFSESVLVEAQLSFTNLLFADFSNSDLSYANLTNSQVTCSELATASRLAGAILPDGTHLPDDETWPEAFADWCGPTQ